MNYEQKYKEALERARVWRDKSGMPKDRQGILDDIFPELAESEDEKIRKTLIEYFNAYPKDYYCELKTSCIIAWLEKQGSAWSEEDEVKINRIVACLENLNVADNDILLKDVDWLKSLKQRMEDKI